MNKTKLLASYLETGATLDASQIERLTGLRNPGEAVRQLRNKGYCIYTNRNGYRLGRPTKRMVAVANAVLGAQIFKGE